MSKESRKQYIEAVQCLQKKPPLSSNTDVPGARSRFDDFSAVHIAQAPFIHFNVSRTLPHVGIRREAH